MARVCGFDGGVASPESVSSVSKAVVREVDDLEGEDMGGGSGSVGERKEEVMDEEWGDEAAAELELGLALGSVKKGKAAATAPHRASCCRILTAKDFPSRASRMSPCPFVSASSGTNLGGGAGVVGTKRAAESVSPDGGVSPHPRSAFVCFSFSLAFSSPRGDNFFPVSSFHFIFSDFCYRAFRRKKFLWLWQKPVCLLM